MKIGMTGLPSSGRTTVFNALTRGHAETGPIADRNGHIGVARVPDQRLRVVTDLFASRTTVQAEVTYVDLPSNHAGRVSKGDLFTGENATQLQRVDALLAVIRSFKDDSVPHLSGSVDWRRDLEKIMFDLNFSDIDLIERRIERIVASFKGMRSGERAAAMQTIETFRGIQQDLENGIPVRAQDPAVTGNPSIRDTYLLSALPFLAAINIDEDELAQSTDYESDLSQLLSGPLAGGTTIAGKLEMELGQLEQGDDETGLREELGAGEPGLSRMIRLSYEVLGLVTFFTAAPNEARAWKITDGTPAPKAAGSVHSDMERGFIRAEVTSYDDLVEYGSEAEARKRGKLRTEGRDYVIKDGDIVNFLFSV